LGEFEILQGGRRPVPRALILTRTGAADQLILAQRLKALGAEVQEGEFRDYSILRWHSDYTPYPTATFGQVLEWLSPGAYPPANDALNGGELPLPVSGVCDTAVVFGPSPGLFGVISQPLRPIASGASALIFLSAGSTTQVGNYRLWVSTARRLARAGYASLRFDIAGVGDSPAGTTSGAPHGSRKQGLANVKAALDWLEAQGFPRIILVAYCLSATLSREVVASDPRVVAQLLINPSQPFGVKPTGRTPARYISLACELRTWRRLLGGAIPPAKMLRGARDLARGVRMGIEKRILGRYARAHTTAASARTLAAQGVDTLLIVGEDDSCVERLEEYFATDRDRLAELLNVRICPLRGVGHDFPRRSDRDLLAGAILEYLQYAPHLQSEPRR
jgi:pimeloyl-ACP methyl ester carboxylesterase